MADFDGTNPILTILGDTATEHEITVTNNTHLNYKEPLTGLNVPSYDNVVILVTGDVAAQDVVNNVAQHNALSPLNDVVTVVA